MLDNASQNQQKFVLCLVPALDPNIKIGDHRRYAGGTLAVPYHDYVRMICICLDSLIG